MNDQDIMWFYIIFTLAIIGMCTMLGIYYYQNNHDKRQRKK